MSGEATGAATASHPQAQARRGPRRALRIRAAVGVGLALVWGSFAEHTWFERRLSQRGLEERDATLAAAISHYGRRILGNAETASRFVASEYAGNPGAGRAQMLVDDRARNDDALRELGMCLADGRVLTSVAVGIAQLTPAECAQLMRRAAGSSAATVPGVVGGALDGAVALVTRSKADPASIAVATVAADTLLGVMNAAMAGQDSAVMLVAPDGLVLASRRGGAAAESTLARVSLDPATALPDEPRILTRQKLAPGEASLVVSTSLRESMVEIRQRHLLYSVFCVLLSAALIVVGARLLRAESKGVRRRMASAVGHIERRLTNERLERIVQERTGQLRQACQDLQTFSHAIAHDVRAPLAAISAFADVLAPAITQSGNERHAKYIRRIRENATRVEELTAHVLRLSKLLAVPVAPCPLDLTAMARDSTDALIELHPSRAVEIRIADGLSAFADRALVQQALDNLIANAWKFTALRTPGIIEIGGTCGPGPGWTTFHVKDNGDGFDTDHAEGMFQPFRRMHTQSEFPGTGIGLATVHRIVTLHGGRIWFESRPGAGATFFFTLRSRPPAS